MRRLHANIPSTEIGVSRPDRHTMYKKLIIEQVELLNRQVHSESFSPEFIAIHAACLSDLAREAMNERYESFPVLVHSDSDPGFLPAS